MQTITEEERLKIFDLLDGVDQIHTILTPIHYMKYHMATARYEAALAWLQRNSIKGKRFLDFYRSDCSNSPLELVRQVTMRIEREKETRPMLYGLDIVS